MARAFAALALVLVACGGSAAPGSIAHGAASAQIALVPLDVKCIALTAYPVSNPQAKQTATFDTVAGRSATIARADYPVGADAFEAKAFGVPCSQISTATPTWVAAPAQATVSASPVQVALKMTRVTP